MIDNNILPMYAEMEKEIVRASGPFLHDSQGHKYLDFEAGDWAAFLGHSPSALTRAIRKQSLRSIHDGLRFYNSPSRRLSELLTELLGMDGGKSLFLNSGSEAVNCSLALVRHIAGRKVILKIDGTYLSAYGIGRASGENDDVISIPMNSCDSLNSIDYTGVAAFAFEPGSSWGMIRCPENEFIVSIAERVKGAGGMLIANEVTTGMGRTGKWFGHQHYEYTPDIVAVGKILGNGYPVSGVVCSGETAELFADKPFRYAQSHQNDPLGCAAGVSVIKRIKNKNYIEQCRLKGEYFRGSLAMLREKYPNMIHEARGRGLMLAIELNSASTAEIIYQKLIDLGFLTGWKEDVIRFMPPVIIRTKHIDRLITALESILQKQESAAGRKL